MPMALDLSDHVAFMVVVNGGAEDCIEQIAHQYGQKVECACAKALITKLRFAGRHIKGRFSL